MRNLNFPLESPLHQTLKKALNLIIKCLILIQPKLFGPFAMIKQKTVSAVVSCLSGGETKDDAVGSVHEYSEENVFEEFMMIAGVGSELRNIECHAMGNIKN